MNRLDLVLRVRSYTRDFSNVTFREQDITLYINEGIERIGQLIPELRGMVGLRKAEDVVTLLPSMYHHLLALYSAARCFEQDERHYQAGKLMNEFETKLQGLSSDVLGGEIVIIDTETGIPITRKLVVDTVQDVYFNHRGGDENVFES